MFGNPSRVEIKRMISPKPQVGLRGDANISFVGIGEVETDGGFGAHPAIAASTTETKKIINIKNRCVSLIWLNLPIESGEKTVFSHSAEPMPHRALFGGRIPLTVRKQVFGLLPHKIKFARVHLHIKARRSSVYR